MNTSPCVEFQSRPGCPLHLEITGSANFRRDGVNACDYHLPNVRGKYIKSLDFKLLVSLFGFPHVVLNCKQQVHRYAWLVIENFVSHRQ